MRLLTLSVIVAATIAVLPSISASDAVRLRGLKRPETCEDINKLPCNFIDIKGTDPSECAPKAANISMLSVTAARLVLRRVTAAAIRPTAAVPSSAPQGALFKL